jgi:hypothetical protein
MVPQYVPLAVAQVSGVQLVGTQMLLGPQVWPAGQLAPQLRLPPQPSPMVPQYWPVAVVHEVSRVQVAGSGPQTPGVAAPQTWPAGQLPQVRGRPQPSPMVPQYWPPFAAVQVMAVQPAPGAQTFATPPPPHTWPVGQAAQLRMPPQPSPMVPQYWPLTGAQVRGVQPAGVAPQTPGVPPPPQVWPAGQPAQSMVRPQPSPTSPQYLPVGCWQVSAVQFVGVEPHTPGIPPPPQVWPAGQPAQSRTRPQPSPMLPQYLPVGC